MLQEPLHDFRGLGQGMEAVAKDKVEMVLIDP